MTQRISWTVFAGSLLALGVSIVELLQEHEGCKQLATVLTEYKHAVLVGASFLGTIGSALLAQMPRSPRRRYRDRWTDDRHVDTARFR